MNPEPLFRIRNLKVEFNGRGEIFHIPQLEILPKDRIAIMGPNGSGKTTFLKTLSGLLEVPSGTIFYKGAPLRVHRRKLTQEVTYVHQHPYLFRGSVYRNLLVGLHSATLTPKEKKHHIQIILERIGLSGYEERDTRELSGGEAYRVALARALLKEPQVLLLDEPTAQADQEAKRIITEALKQVTHKGNTTLIFATHDESLCRNLEVRILRIEEFSLCRY